MNHPICWTPMCEDPAAERAAEHGHCDFCLRQFHQDQLTKVLREQACGECLRVMADEQMGRAA